MDAIDKPRPGTQLRQPDYWSIPRDWEGQTAFLICGGPSVTETDIGKLRGRHVVVLNSSYQICPWADAVVFSDLRWWDLHKDREAFKSFAGLKVSIVIGAERDDIRVCSRVRPPLSEYPHALAIGHTTVTTGIDYLVHKGVTRIGILGLDGKDEPEGRIWHHEPHPEDWKRVKDCYKFHGEELRKVQRRLIELGIMAVNVNMDSAHAMFVKWPLDDLLEQSP